MEPCVQRSTLLQKHFKSENNMRSLDITLDKRILFRMYKIVLKKLEMSSTAPLRRQWTKLQSPIIVFDGWDK